MMKEQQYLLSKLAEEAGELAQIAMKCQQFGMEEVYEDESNVERLLKELIDVMGIMSILQGIGYIRTITEEEMTEGIAAKIKKVGKYHKYAIEMGQVSPETGGWGRPVVSDVE